MLVINNDRSLHLDEAEAARQRAEQQKPRLEYLDRFAGSLAAQVMQGMDEYISVRRNAGANTAVLMQYTTHVTSAEVSFNILGKEEQIPSSAAAVERIAIFGRAMHFVQQECARRNLQPNFEYTPSLYVPGHKLEVSWGETGGFRKY